MEDIENVGSKAFVQFLNTKRKKLTNKPKSIVTYGAGEYLFKIDHADNKVTIYGKSVDDESWKIAGTEIAIDTKELNSTEINITVDGIATKITTNALKIEYLLYGSYKQTNYIQDGILYSGSGSVNEGAELRSGYHTQSLIKYVNTSALPTE